MKKSTAAYALSVLDSQFQNCTTSGTNAEQAAYYQGMLTMLNMLVNEGYTSKTAIERAPGTGQHFVRYGNGAKMFSNHKTA